MDSSLEIIPDGESTIGPVPSPFKEWLVFFVKVEGSKKRIVVFVPSGSMLRLIDEEGLQKDAICLLPHAELFSELRGSRPKICIIIFKYFV